MLTEPGTLAPRRANEAGEGKSPLYVTYVARIEPDSSIRLAGRV